MFVDQLFHPLGVLDEASIYWLPTTSSCRMLSKSKNVSIVHDLFGLYIILCNKKIFNIFCKPSIDIKDLKYLRGVICLGLFAIIQEDTPLDCTSPQTLVWAWVSVLLQEQQNQFFLLIQDFLVSKLFQTVPL